MIGTYPKTVLGNLVIKDCNTITFTDSGSWEFPCGLYVDEEYSGCVVRSGHLPHQVHLRHHEHKMHDDSWYLVETVNTGDFSHTITLDCSCDEFHRNA